MQLAAQGYFNTIQRSETKKCLWVQAQRLLKEREIQILVHEILGKISFFLISIAILLFNLPCLISLLLVNTEVNYSFICAELTL